MLHVPLSISEALAWEDERERANLPILKTVTYSHITMIMTGFR